MRKNRRIAPVTTLQVESLDARVVPSAVGLSSHVHAAIVHHASFAVPRHAVAVPHHAALMTHAAHPVTLGASFPTAMTLAFSSTISYTAPTPTPVATAPAAAPAVVASFSATPGNTAAIFPVTPTVVPSSGTTPVTTPTPSATTPSINEIKSGPLAKAGQTLIQLYDDFQNANGGAFSSTAAAGIEVVGNDVGLDVRTNGDVNAFAATLTGLGMQVQSIDTNSGTVEGLLPISKLPDVAQLSQTISMNPIYRPHLA